MEQLQNSNFFYQSLYWLNAGPNSLLWKPTRRLRRKRLVSVAFSSSSSGSRSSGPFFCSSWGSQIQKPGPGPVRGSDGTDLPWRAWHTVKRAATGSPSGYSSSVLVASVHGPNVTSNDRLSDIYKDNIVNLNTALLCSCDHYSEWIWLSLDSYFKEFSLHGDANLMIGKALFNYTTYLVKHIFLERKATEAWIKYKKNESVNQQKQRVKTPMLLQPFSCNFIEMLC